MELLKAEFDGIGDVRGVHFSQIKKSDKAVLYKLTENGHERFEVFELRIQKAGTAKFGDQIVKFEEKEIYPTTNNFGDWAFCYTLLPDALKRFDEINNRQK